MIFPLSTQYAIRALIHLAQIPQGMYGTVDQIAGDEGISPGFLAKILQRLERTGLLRSRSGTMGGFCLRAPAGEISLMDVIEVQHQKSVCALHECSDDDPCAMHDEWKELQTRIIGYFEQTTISDLVDALDKKKRPRGCRPQDARRGCVH
ncbi:MAG: Rrf2 family transcriptional regulator [Bryobacteraceae bacterium]